MKQRQCPLSCQQGPLLQRVAELVPVHALEEVRHERAHLLVCKNNPGHNPETPGPEIGQFFIEISQNNYFRIFQFKKMKLQKFTINFSK